MKTWVGRREATKALQDLGCCYNHLNLKRKAGELDGLFIKDPRTKQGHWLYDVEGIREKVLSGELYFGAHRPPIVERRTELRVTFAISLELAEKLLKRDHDTELVILQEIRNAVGLTINMKENK